jgi:hypothetical protein
MTPPPQPEYTLMVSFSCPAEIQEDNVREYIKSQIFGKDWSGLFATNYISLKTFDMIRSRPHTPAPAPERFPDSTELLLVAHDEWKRREERKHLHDEITWVSGWISGFLTSKKFVIDQAKSLRRQENP